MANGFWQFHDIGRFGQVELDNTTHTETPRSCPRKRRRKKKGKDKKREIFPVERFGDDSIL
jgi:hypothetical protein